MCKTFVDANESRELEILAALADGTATDEQIAEVVRDIQRHLSTPTGTLANYNGRFKKSGLKSLQENYHLFTNEELYTHTKLATIFNSIASRIVEGKKTVIPPAIFAKLIDFIEGKNKSDVVDGVKYVTIGYDYHSSGQFISPESKLEK